MSSRYSAARPKRAGEAYARSHQQQQDGDPRGESGSGSGSGYSGRTGKKVLHFDVRNPSILAPDATEEGEEEEGDAVLEADVIGRGFGATKRGAVNIEGYDSDSDNENFDARARRRRTGDVDLAKQLDSYDAKGGAQPQPQLDQDDDDDDDDMFAPDDDEARGIIDKGDDDDGGKKKKNKSVSFLDPEAIQGTVEDSTSGGRVHLESDHDSDTEDNEEKMDEAIVEQGLDQEIGRGGLKRHAPKLEAFNMKEEQEEGGFDQEGNYVRKAIDPDAIHDNWLQGLSKKEIRKAAEAHDKRRAEQRKRRLEDDRVLTSELLTRLITNLERGETPLEALARLGRCQKKKKEEKEKTRGKEKKVPRWKAKKQKAAAGAVADEMDVDEAKPEKDEEDPDQVRIKDGIDAITESADRLMGRDRPDIYDRERELLVREYRRETDEEWVEPQVKKDKDNNAQAAPTSAAAAMWEYRWTDGRDGGQQQGPYDGLTMKAWQDAGYFSQGIEFRQIGSDGAWRQVVGFV